MSTSGINDAVTNAAKRSTQGRNKAITTRSEGVNGADIINPVDQHVDPQQGPACPPIMTGGYGAQVGRAGFWSEGANVNESLISIAAALCHGGEQDGFAGIYESAGYCASSADPVDDLFASCPQHAGASTLGAGLRQGDNVDTGGSPYWTASFGAQFENATVTLPHYGNGHYLPGTEGLPDNHANPVSENYAAFMSKWDSDHLQSFTNVYRSFEAYPIAGQSFEPPHPSIPTFYGVIQIKKFRPKYFTSSSNQYPQSINVMFDPSSTIQSTSFEGARDVYPQNEGCWYPRHDASSTDVRQSYPVPSQDVHQVQIHQPAENGVVMNLDGVQSTPSCGISTSVDEGNMTVVVPLRQPDFVVQSRVARQDTAWLQEGLYASTTMGPLMSQPVLMLTDCVEQAPSSQEKFRSAATTECTQMPPDEGHHEQFQVHAAEINGPHVNDSEILRRKIQTMLASTSCSRVSTLPPLHRFPSFVLPRFVVVGIVTLGLVFGPRELTPQEAAKKAKVDLNKAAGWIEN
ncbi:hypothetical protein BDN70DRAFT_937709 [Pholiota conissans]|uniref:Uncharacterized protein n=1 Tax=Pholiota conissans TaxID=109636 RepID=A0A9P5YQ60_9AGAR|nr:hypothetical protein BDN70DRAFT_937709 [Pholiota conissans]